MKITGYTRINKNRNGGKPARCMNCKGEGVYRVTFEDMYSKLTVTLCDDCRKLKYGQLKLQTTFKWSVSR